MKKLEAKNIYLLYLLMVAFSVLLILGYELLPDKRLILAPGSSFSVYTHGDKDQGGNSSAQFVDKARTQWRCQLREGVKEPNYPSCRIGIAINSDPEDWTAGVDLSDYEFLKIQFDYSGPATFFRAHFRNFDSEISHREDYNSAKFVNLIIRNPGLNSDYYFALTEFKLADWWIQQYSVPNELAKSSFDRVTSFELDFAEPVPFGEHFIKLKNIELIGRYISAENWYLGILMSWMVIFALIGAVRLRQLNRISNLQAQHIKEMKKYAEDLKQQSIKYKNLSHIDPLTGTMNRLGLQEIIDGAVQWRKENGPVALFLMDLDHFKRINDTNGHEAGDKVLKALGKMLIDSTRSVDSVARWGGEEFILLCHNTGREAAMVLAEKLRVQVSQMEFADYGGQSITTSIGITLIKPDESFELAFDRADKALYDAKNSGRNCWIYS